MGGSGSRAAATADRVQQQVRPDAVALPSTCRFGTSSVRAALRHVHPARVGQVAQVVERRGSVRGARRRLRRRSRSADVVGDVRRRFERGRQDGRRDFGESHVLDGRHGRRVLGGRGEDAVAQVSVCPYRRMVVAGRDHRRTWGFRKLKTRSDSAVSSPEATEATLKQTPTNLAADAGFAAECAPRSPTVDKTADQSPQAGLAVAHEPNPSAAAPAPGADDYACLAEDDINWSTGYVKLCYMPDALNQECSSFQDLRKGPYDFPAATVQSQVVVERFHGVEQRVNLRDGRSVFGETTERICYGRKTSQVAVFDGNGTSEQSACELMTFDTTGTVVLQRSVTVAQQNHSSSQCTEPQTSQPGVTDNATCVTTAQEQQKVPYEFYGNWWCCTRTNRYPPVPNRNIGLGESLSGRSPSFNLSNSNSMLNTAGETSTTAVPTGVVPRRNVRRTRSSTAAPSYTPSGTALPRTSRVPTHLLGTSHTGAETEGASRTSPPGATSVPKAPGTTTGIASTLRENVPVPGSVPKTTVASWQREGHRRRRPWTTETSRTSSCLAKTMTTTSASDEDLCADGGNAVAAAPTRPGSGNNQNFEVNLGSREAGGTAAGHRVAEDGFRRQPGTG
ncbi:hypothetical protein MRX96_022131 [Rhipicephalus microplus]